MRKLTYLGLLAPLIVGAGLLVGCDDDHRHARDHRVVEVRHVDHDHGDRDHHGHDDDHRDHHDHH